MIERMRLVPVDSGAILSKSEKDQAVSEHKHTFYRAGIGKLLHMKRWSRQETQNVVRQLSRQSSAPNKAHVKAMK